MRFFSYDFVFSNKPRHRVARHATFWSIFIVFSAVLYGFIPISHGVPGKFNIPVWLIFLSSFGDAILFTINHALLTYLILYFLLPRYFFKEKYVLLFIGLVVCVFLSLLVSVFVSEVLVEGFHTMLGELASKHLRNSATANISSARRSPLGAALMAGLRGGLTIAGFATAIKLSKHWYLKQKALQQTEKEKLTAELQLLKAQLHPHFLFNTLNNLYALTLAKSDQSPEVVLKLSGLLSYILYECNVPEVPLKKEIQILKNYAELEQMRYGSRVEVSLNFTGDIEHKTIAPLLLLPFVENAFKHGSSEQIEQAWISLDLSVEEKILKFKLINSKNEDAPMESNRGGIGLQNVRKRLELIYPGRHELKISAQNEIFVVNLTLELNEISSVQSDELSVRKDSTSSVLSSEVTVVN
ncbi:MAG: histidine kinase [Cytophagales bacterium]|jgi:sensor histidine kinase YesM|nr:histidine kinase [Cytophagales bacterium]